MSFLVAESMYRADERQRPEWPGAAVVLAGVPIAFVAYHAASDGAGAAVPVITVTGVIALTSVVALRVAAGGGPGLWISVLAVTVAGGALFALERAAGAALGALITVSSPLAAVVAWLIARGLHLLRSAHADAVHIEGFRPYPPGQRTPGRARRQQPGTQPPRSLPPPSAR